MKLSIGMIVKNEEKYLEQCLTALKPILENVDSELIIADTGSTDRTVEIAKQFTDNVFHFEWINDFAAARNSTLDKAKGEWYMFIDADEIIKDPTELIEFFNSGEYRKYGSANYIQRNYNDLANMELYSDFRPYRMTALKNNVRFIKPIHENFNQVLYPIKKINCVADHYGYVYKDGNVSLGVRETKTSRNLDMLFQELETEEGKNNPMVYLQISDCYRWLEDSDNAIKYIDMALEKCGSSFARISCYNSKLTILRTQKGKAEEVIDVCKEYFSEKNTARSERIVSDAYVYFCWAVSAFDLGDYDETISRTVIGFEVYNNYLSGKLSSNEMNFVAMEVNIPFLKRVFVLFITACNKKNKLDIASREVEKITIKEFMGDKDFALLYLQIRTELMESTNYNKISDVYFQLDTVNRARYINVLVRNIFKTKKTKHFLKKLSLVAGEDERLADIVNIYNCYFINHNLTSGILAEFVKKHGTKDNDAILGIIMKVNADISAYLTSDDFNAKKTVEELFGNFADLRSGISIFDNYNVRQISDSAVEKAENFFAQAAFFIAKKGPDPTRIIANCEKLANRWIELHPDEQTPESIAFALKLGKIAEIHRKRNYTEAISQLKELIGDSDESIKETDDENMAMLRHYLKVVQNCEIVNSQIVEKQKENAALTELAEKIKQEIRTMIDAWDLDGAEDALNQMAKMAPFDPDIEDIRDEIIDRKINYMNYM